MKNSKNTITINQNIIGNNKTFIIAEIGNNHNGSLETAFKMIDLIAETGADCAKFQMRHLDQVYRKKALLSNGEDLGTEYIVDLLKKFELEIEDHQKLSEYCNEKGIIYLCTPWDTKSVESLQKINVPAYKIASADLTNIPLIDTLIKTQKPLILSTGMSTFEELEFTVNFLEESKAKFVLLHCNSTYPAPFTDINLNFMSKLKSLHPLIGYSGHERGVSISLAAVALGACVLERHFTLNRGMEGPDHAASLEFDEFKTLVQGVKEINEAMGSSKDRTMSQGEMINRENLSKSLVAVKDLSAGTILNPKHIKVLSPGQGLSPQKYSSLLGKTLTKDISKEDFFFQSHISENAVEPKSYKFKRNWGIPVRYHDFQKYSKMVSPNFFEFHLSYSDMELNPSNFLTGPYECGFVVHAPELFSGSNLMDLASPDEEYRKFSISETQKVINITRQLNTLFPNEKNPLIVANIGGFTMDKPLPHSEKRDRYELFGESLNELDRTGVEIIPQTMAPFPWHFGGQRYQNLFVNIEEIIEWCEVLNLRMCYDVSHTMLTCNHFNTDFYSFSDKISSICAYLHMGDATGINGEGLQIGEGEIDFTRLGYILNKKCPNAGFIPEIWQGHKNFGEGFWIALNRLEGLI